MPKDTPSRRARRGNNEAEYGFEYWYQRYRTWVLTHQEKKTLFVVVATVISAALIAVATFLPLHRTVSTIVAFPAGVLFFLVPLGLLFLSESSNPGKERFKERVPPSRRRRIAFVGGILLAIMLMSVGGVIPYALGGSIMMASVLGLYNLARRTPEEIALAIAGIPDPRENTILVGDETVDEDLLADTDDVENNSYREA